MKDAAAFKGSAEKEKSTQELMVDSIIVTRVVFRGLFKSSHYLKTPPCLSSPPNPRPPCLKSKPPIFPPRDSERGVGRHSVNMWAREHWVWGRVHRAGKGVACRKRGRAL